MLQWFKANRGFVAFLMLLGLFRTAIADWNPIPSGSMHPNLLEGDVVLVNRLAYNVKLPLTDVVVGTTGEPQRGDMVTFSSPQDGTRMIKRLVALPGDVVAMQDNRLFINGQAAQYTDQGPALEPLEAGVQLAAQRQQETVLGTTRLVQWLPQVHGRSSFEPVTVPAGQYLMLGDNRDNSADSRYIGFVPRALLIGRAERVLVSADITDHWQPRWARFGLNLAATPG